MARLFERLRYQARRSFGNKRRAKAFENRRNLDKIGQAPRPEGMEHDAAHRQRVLHPQQNKINFPAGILQPPFFDPKLDDSVNYGGIGAVIGHEITHGFDDRADVSTAKAISRTGGRKPTGRQFDKRAECIDKEYSEYVATGDVHLNGKLTLGENVADNGGVRIALMAFMDSIANKRLTRSTVSRRSSGTSLAMGRSGAAT